MREEYLRTQSWNGRLLEPTRHLSHCRRAPQADLAGIVVHQTGRALARFHYCADYQGQVPAWLEQALAYWLSIEYLGRNTVTSVAVDEEKRRYARQGDKTKTRESDDRVGTRSFFHSLALTEGAKIELLMQRNLVDMEDADIAKSWSFFDFLAHAGEAEQRLIFRAAQCQREPGGFVACWRASIETLLEIEEGDAFRALEERWRAYAETAQGTAGE